MPHAFRLFLTITLAAAALLPMPGKAEESAAQLIIGKWRHVSLVRVIDDKLVSPQVTSGTLIAEFTSDGTWSSSGGAKSSSGTYRWLDAHNIEQTVLESGLPIQIGVITNNEVRVTADKLELISIHTSAEMDKFGPPKPGVIRAKKTVVTSTFSRLPSIDTLHRNVN